MSEPIDYRARIERCLINSGMQPYGAADLLEGLIRQTRDGYPDEAAVHQQLADAQATIDRVRETAQKAADRGVVMSPFALLDTLNGPSATGAALARQRADGHAARIEAMDRTEHADLNRHHMRPTDDRPATRCTAGLLPEGPGSAEQCFQRAGHLGTHIGNRGARWSTEEGDTDAPGAPGA